MKYSIALLVAFLGIAFALPHGMGGKGGKGGEGQGHVHDGHAILPNEIQLLALDKIGETMMEIAAKAWKEPQGAIDLLNTILPAEGSIGSQGKRGMGGGHGKGKGPGHAMGPGKGKQAGPEKILTHAIMEHGLYEVTLSQVFLTGVMLQHVRTVIEHGMALEGCKDDPTTCPDKPNLPAIIANELSQYEDLSHLGDIMATDIEDPMSTSEEDDDEGDVTKRALIAKLLKLLS